jgi:hypothetical protein
VSDETAARAAPVVSVVTPCFNAGDLLPRAVASVRRQSFPDWEMVIVDDGSTDGRTVAVARALVDERVRLIELPRNRGPGVARNTAIRAARADIIVPIDADDELPPEALREVVAAFTAAPEADYVHGYFVVVEANGVEREVHPVPPEDPGLLPFHPLSPYRRRLWARFGGYDERPSFSAGAGDWMMWLRVLRGGARGRAVPAVLLRYHRRPESLSAEVRPTRVWAVLEVFDELRELLDLEHARRALAWTAYQASVYWRVRGQPWRAVGFLAATVARHPRLIAVWRTLLGCLAESAIPPLRRRYTGLARGAPRA